MRARRSTLSSLLVSALVAGSLGAVGCGGEPPDPERVILERERTNLREYLETPRGEPLVQPGDVLVAVSDDLFQTVFEATLPQTAVVADRYRVTVDTADVRIRSGLALVELTGRASPADDPELFADVRIYGLLNVVGIDPERSTLLSRVEILALETRDVGIRGVSPPAERVVDALARRRTEEFDELLGEIEIPVSLSESVNLPAVTAEEVTSRGGDLSFRVRVVDVKALEDRLWVSLTAGFQVPRFAPDTVASDTAAPAGSTDVSSSGSGAAPSGARAAEP